ncbi:hypothetical protein AQPE_2025 [Aquipluma nitroreducens]|uniref:Uncharacterized protein n=1 Tax=Aquipluma nitroreducens TaxID=2010828 RepID=A0A5K7S8L3_9BACT|nr:UPF0280 family protein [Aquipluma nitroreducens]BBE17866.1 hypothetical protein AQPE_2025 [Aquipluma nitroreducens]
MIEQRTYRNQFSQQRFRSFVVNYKETDLWIGVDPGSFRDEMQEVALAKVIALRTEMEAYLLNDPVFGRTFEPHAVKPNAPEIVNRMADAARRAEVGPMAAVAGAFSEAVGQHLMQQFSIQEIVVENGGDIFLKINRNLLMSVYAGNSPLSGKIGIEIQASESPLGVCTSAGTVGPSVSLGKTDATMIICRNTALADALATRFGNLVQVPEDVQQVTQQTVPFPEILSAVIICWDKIGIRGQFEMKLLR